MPAKPKMILPGLILIIALAFLTLEFCQPEKASASTYAPDVTSNSASSIGSDYGTLNGQIDDVGSSDITQYGFYWGTDSSCDTKRKVGSSISDGEDFHYDLSGLDADTEYYFKAYATNDDGTSYGSVKHFTTGTDNSSDAPSVISNSASSIGDDYGTLNGQIDSIGSSDITQYGFYWGTDSSCDTKRKVGSSISDGEDFHYDLSGLDTDTEYYFKAYATNDDGTSYGSVKHFTTGTGNSSDAPSVISNSASSIGDDYGTLNGQIDSIGSSDITQYGFYWGTDSSCDTKRKVGSSISDGEDFYYDLSGLDTDTEYYFKAYAINDDGTSYGSVKHFTTGQNNNGNEPSVTTNTPTVNNDYTTLNGVVTSRGDSAIESYGFYWGTDSSPDTRVVVGTDNISVDETFSYNLHNLSAGQTYYVKAYATNSDGTDYGSVLSFTSEQSGVLASLTTNTSDISASGATLLGTITSDGGATVREYGFVWGQTGGVETKVRIGTSLATNANFAYFLGGLLPGSNYYAKAYAINSAGTAYGAQVNFTTTGAGTVVPGSPSGSAPVVNITSPSTGSTVVRGAVVSINATATDDVSVNAVGLYLNGVKKMCCGGNWLAYYLDTSGMSPGLYTIRITAWDGSKVGEQTITFYLK